MVVSQYQPLLNLKPRRQAWFSLRLNVQLLTADGGKKWHIPSLFITVRGTAWRIKWNHIKWNFLQKILWEVDALKHLYFVFYCSVFLHTYTLYFFTVVEVAWKNPHGDGTWMHTDSCWKGPAAECFNQKMCIHPQGSWDFCGCNPVKISVPVFCSVLYHVVSCKKF